MNSKACKWNCFVRNLSNIVSHDTVEKEERQLRRQIHVAEIMYSVDQLCITKVWCLNNHTVEVYWISQCQITLLGQKSVYHYYYYYCYSYYSMLGIWINCDSLCFQCIIVYIKINLCQHAQHTFTNMQDNYTMMTHLSCLTTTSS